MKARVLATMALALAPLSSMADGIDGPYLAATIGAAIPAVGLHVHRRNLVLGTAIFPNGVRTMIER